MGESGSPLGEHASEVGVAPRLRSLRISEEAESIQEPSGSLRPSTPRSVGDGERSPLRIRVANADSLLHRNSANGQKQYKRTVGLCLGFVGLLVAAFFAGSAYQGHSLGIPSLAALPSTGSASSSSSKAVVLQGTDVFQTVKLPVSEQDSLVVEIPAAKESRKSLPTKTPPLELEAEKPAPKTKSTAKEQPSKGTKTKELPSKTSPASKLDVAKEVGKAVAYSSAKGSQAVPDPGITENHLKIFVAELKPRYNTDLLEALISLVNDGVVQGKTSTQAQETAKAVISNPFGDAIGSVGSGLHSTSPGNLDVYFYSQLLNSPLRTDDVLKADIVFVPFWVHKLVKLDKELEKPNKHDLAMTDFWKDAPFLLPTLGQKPHVIVIPGNEAELRATCGGHGLDFLCHPQAKNFTVLTPEVLTGRGSSLATTRVAPGIIGSIKEGSGSVAVPDFSNFHFSEVPRDDVSVDKLKAAKSVLIAQAFRARAPLRKALRAQCMQHGGECIHNEPPVPSHHSGGSFTTSVFKENEDAWFCSQPPGDTAIRTSFYDCMLTSTIPVVFDNKLPKILPFTDIVTWETFLANIAPDDILKGKKDFVELLKSKYSEQDRLAKLAVVANIRHLFQYSRTPAHHLARFDHLDAVTRQDDAFTMSLKAVLRHLCRSGRLPERCS